MGFLQAFVICFILLYLFYCGKNGWYWACDIADTYILMIVRVIVVFILSILSVFTVFSKYGDQLFLYGKYCLYIAIVWGIIMMIPKPEKL